MKSELSLPFPLAIWDKSTFDAHLEAFRPQIGHYGVLWRLLRLRAKQTGFPPRKMYPLMRRFFRPNKPYFVGTQKDGLRFLGDYRDRYSVDHMALPDESDVQTELLKRCMGSINGAVLDIGTNMGLVSTELARHDRARPLFAFEPIQETAKRAAATFALNQLENVRLLPIALGERDEMLTFFHAPGHSDYASAHPTPTHILIGWTEMQTPCATLDTLRATGILPPVGIIKMDVEGHELSVLHGAKGLIARDRPFVVMEYNYRIAPDMGWTANDVRQIFLEATGENAYQFASLHHDGRPESFPPPPTGHGMVHLLCIPTEHADAISSLLPAFAP